MPPRLPDLIVFDLDGTLIDSRADLAAAANELVAELGGVPLDEVTIGGMIGEGVTLLVERVLAAGCGISEAGESHVARFREIYGAHLLVRTRAYPGVDRLLDALAGRTRLAVLTNKPLGPALQILEGLYLRSYFRQIIGGDGPLPRKPDPAALRALMESVGAEGDDTLLIGDSRVDFQTGRAAETAIAMARYGFGYEHFPESLLQGDEVILDAPDELIAYLGL
jgi:phosphoglycolate phosphatase